jgi:hypothetical protein
MNKFLNRLIITSSFCIIIGCVSASSCDKHTNIEQETNNESAQSSLKSADQERVKFDYTKVTKDLPENVKKEVEAYYEKTDKAYDELTEEGKKVVQKISRYKKKIFSKKIKNDEKKVANS